MTENPNFVSSFVIGGAGLIATSLYQCNQTQMARQQADSQQRIAREQADNNWRIERAKILSQNLQTLTARGGDNVEQRYGVLLSLTRGSILEPDVAVSYALELGKDNPEYMGSVLGNIERKDEAHYRRLATAYLPTCNQRYGISSPLVEPCKADKLAARSLALAGVIADETEQALTASSVTSALSSALSSSSDGPMRLLSDEREVNASLLRMHGLFGPFLQEMYERRQWSAIEKFMNYSTGARLVGTLVLVTLAGENGVSADQDKISEFHAQLQDWLEKFLLNPSCDSECRSRVLNIMLSHFDKGQRHFVPLLKLLLKRSHNEVAATVTRLNTRLLWCQMDPDDVQVVRDQVIVPLLLAELQPVREALAAVPVPPPPAKAVTLPAGAFGPPSPVVRPPASAPTRPAATSPVDVGALVAKAKIDVPLVEDLIGLFALLPEPVEQTAAWTDLTALFGKLQGSRLATLLGERRQAAQGQRKAAAQALLPATPALSLTLSLTKGEKAAVAPVVGSKKRISFCQVAEDESQEPEEE